MQTRSYSVGWITLFVSVLLAACAAQAPKTTPAAPAAAPVAPAAPPAPPVAAKPVRSPQDIGIAELLDDPKKLAVFRKHAPDIADNPQISQARAMSLGEVAGYASGILTPAVLKAIAEDLAKL
jgi:hypothetical protein